jgi:hypothetical protein
MKIEVIFLLFLIYDFTISGHLMVSTGVVNFDHVCVCLSFCSDTCPPVITSKPADGFLLNLE